MLERSHDDCARHGKRLDADCGHYVVDQRHDGQKIYLARSAEETSRSWTFFAERQVDHGRLEEHMLLTHAIEDPP